STPVTLSNASGESQEARIAVDPAGRIYVVWDEQDPTRHIALARSADGGASFTNSTVAPVVRPIGSCPPDATTASCTAYPGIAIDQTSGSVYVIWHDFVSGVLQIVFSRSTDAGNTFSIPLNISRAPIHAHCASISVGPTGKIHVSFESRKDLTEHKHDAEYVQSADGGLWWGAPVNLSHGPSWAFSDYPWPAEGPGGVVVVGWEDNTRGGELDAVVAVSADGGHTFSPSTDISENDT